MARFNHAGRGEIDAPVDGGLAFGGTPAVVFGASYAAGSASTLLRTDDQIKFPSALLSLANASTLTFTDDAVDGTLTGSLGTLNLRPAAFTLSLPRWTGG